MIAAYFILAAFVLIAAGIDNRRTRNAVVAEILAAEQRQIERERQRGLATGVAVMDALGKSANR